MTAKKPPTKPWPRTGGRYTRDADGSLTCVEAPAVPAPEPADKPAAKAKPKPAAKAKPKAAETAAGAGDGEEQAS